MKIPRLQLFEFEDFGWFPMSVRDLMTDFLRHSTIRLRLHQPIVALLRDVLREAQTDRVVDLCSGGGGLLVAMQPYLSSHTGSQIRVTFTDKYPNTDALDPICAANPQALSVLREPVDATAVPRTLAGLRTMFSALHHFPPRVARAILADAADSGNGIAVIEVSRRSLGGFVPMLLSPLAVFLMTPGIRPFTFRRFLLTYVIPAVPFFVMWDGIVSALRTYTVSELDELVRELPANRLNWRSGMVRGPHRYRITYLFGVPTAS